MSTLEKSPPTLSIGMHGICMRPHSMNILQLATGKAFQSHSYIPVSCGITITYKGHVMHALSEGPI